MNCRVVFVGDAAATSCSALTPALVTVAAAAAVCIPSIEVSLIAPESAFDCNSVLRIADTLTLGVPPPIAVPDRNSSATVAYAVCAAVAVACDAIPLTVREPEAHRLVACRDLMLLLHCTSSTAGSVTL